MMLFQPDYIISWDVSDQDNPTVNISKLYSDGKHIHLQIDVLGVYHDKCGVVSIQQLLNEFNRGDYSYGELRDE